MNIIIEMTVAEFQFRRKGFWRETSDKYTWIALSLMLIAAAFVLESSIAIPKPGDINAKIGGPVSWFGVAGAVGLVLYARRKSKHVSNILQDVANDKIVFMRFDKFGIEYGIRETWAKRYSWDFVTCVEIKSDAFEFELPYGGLTVRTETLKPEEAPQLMEFARRRRDLILPEPFFGWRRKPAKECYGPVRR